MSTPLTESRRFAGRIYPLDSFDKHLCLKPSIGLLACILFLCRDFMFALMSALASMKGNGMDFGMLVEHQNRLYFTLGLIPALAVLAAFVRRVPDAAAKWRWIWKHGALLLSASALIQSIPAVLALLNGHASSATFSASPWILVLTAWMMIYLFASARARDTFADFPERT